MDGDKIAGGMGVIENDFHDRKDLAPNVCAVWEIRRKIAEDVNRELQKEGETYESRRNFEILS